MWNFPRMPVAVSKQYDASLDAKMRITLPGAKFKHFRIVFRKDGSFVGKPIKKLAEAKGNGGVSAKALRQMTSSLKSMKAGKRSKQVDLAALAAMKL
jgi:hypothetical protein